MSVNVWDKTSSKLIVIAGGTRCWIGSKAAHDAEELAGKLPNNVMVAILNIGLF